MEKYGLIGCPLGHSFSRAFFTEKFRREGRDAAYLNFEIADAAMLPSVLRANPELRGLNVTIPHKRAVIPLLDGLSDEARAIGAVNVIRVRDGRLTGHNSDVTGFTRSLAPLLRPWHRKALVLGTGGASLAVRAGLDKLGVDWLAVSRAPKDGELSYADITPGLLAERPVVVNCTPLGMYPRTDGCPPLPYGALTERNLLYDLVYNPEETEFMRRGAARGAQVKNGLEMLRLQALASWEIWNS